MLEKLIVLYWYSYDISFLYGAQNEAYKTIY